MTHRPYAIDQMISAKSIAARIEDLSAEIAEDFKDTDKLVVVGLLRGSFVFIADLVRELDLPVEVDFLEASSYGNAMESSREVRRSALRMNPPDEPDVAHAHEAVGAASAVETARYARGCRDCVLRRDLRRRAIRVAARMGRRRAHAPAALSAPEFFITRGTQPRKIIARVIA